MANKQNIIPDDLMEHALYHVLIGRIERHFEIDPCPAIKASSALTDGLMADARGYIAWSGDDKTWSEPRDPRQDPIPGDVLCKGNSTRLVVSVRDAYSGARHPDVYWRREGCPGREVKIWLPYWRQWAKGAEVIRVAESAPQQEAKP